MAKIDSGIILNPTDQYKMDILKLLNKIENLDIDNNKKGFISGVKHLTWKIVKYIPKSVRLEIDKIYKVIDEEKQKLDASGLSDETKEKRHLNIEYKHYNTICEYVTKIVSYSPIVHEEITGVLNVGKDVEDFNKLNDLIKKGEKELLQLDKGDIEEGEQKIED